jgi:hypothetical protein
VAILPHLENLMNLKRLAVRLGVLIAVGSLMSGCIVVPMGHGGYYGHYDGGHEHHEGQRQGGWR